MKKRGTLILFIFLYQYSFSQTHEYWQQQVDYKIDVSLNDTLKTLDGYVSMQYHNNSPDTLRFIWLHTWPNAYKNDRTAFSDQLLKNGRTDFYFSNDEKRGYINRLDFKVDKVTARTQDHPQHQDIIKLMLPKPLAPGSLAVIETPFHVKLPYNFSRGGYINKSFQITQWYPKPAVYDKTGWHEIPYLDQGEFYSEFGQYNVQVTLPKDYIVAATGLLKDQSDNGDTKTYHYFQENVHDFAWFADKDFMVMHDTLNLAARTIDVYVYCNKKNANAWKNGTGYIKSAIETKTKWVGDYPYDIVTVVEKPGASNGGMEYPTITLISNPGNEKGLDEVIDHEVGHNWFYGILATNEREHPWMDEGMNSYYDQRYTALKYGGGAFQVNAGKSSFMRNRMPEDIEAVVLESLVKVNKDQPIETPSEKFSEINYDAVAYGKTAQWMKSLEAALGQPLFDSVMHAYYAAWKFRHPFPEDFKNIVRQVSGQNVDSSFSLLNKKGRIGPVVKKDLKLAAFFSLKETTRHNYIFLSPAIGYNFYDKFMIGGLIHNYTLPLPNLKFLVAPLYATGSHEINGSGRIGYSWYMHKGQEFELAVAVSKFTADEFTDDAGNKNYLPFSKLVPSLKYVFANKDPLSHTRKYLQWKTYLIRETGLAFNTDTVSQSDIVSYPKADRYVNQLRFVLENNRVLYPYNASLQAEQGKSFVRLAFTGNYFFNYAKAGGLNVRFFAGKFIYTVDKTFVSQYETDRYHLNMSGPKGNEDYTYSNYFTGRNEFEGFSNQQLMIRDGAFKVRSDLLSNKIGKTDDWLTAANFSTSIPRQVNPLSVLPIKIPLKLFCDVGTYADAWKTEDGNGKFLYDAGFQLSLFKDVINIYFPVFYSKVYRDYFKSTITEKKFVKNISFSLDIQNISIRKFVSQIPF